MVRRMNPAIHAITIQSIIQQLFILVDFSLKYFEKPRIRSDQSVSAGPSLDVRTAGSDAPFDEGSDAWFGS